MPFVLRPPLLTALPTIVLVLTLCCSLAASPALAAAPPAPDFEEDLSLGLHAAQLRKLGATPCAQANLCLPVRWNEQAWKAAPPPRARA